MPTYTVRFVKTGDPEAIEEIEFEADKPDGLFAKLERERGVVSATLWEDGDKIGTLRRSTAGIWEIT
ncbi:hypothetical protein [Pelagerythrobacter sp.]|uniref:hypothetical protein n=1 Tax=Pelagerythrobacter sp. TaxID=2800702 RepID=UPI0035B4D63A